MTDQARNLLSQEEVKAIQDDVNARWDLQTHYERGSMGTRRVQRIIGDARYRRQHSCDPGREDWHEDDRYGKGGP